MLIGTKLLSTSAEGKEQTNCKFSENAEGDRFFGEHDDLINGMGVRVTKHGSIRIGYWKNGVAEAGKMIYIGSDGVLQVGQLFKDSQQRMRW